MGNHPSSSMMLLAWALQRAGPPVRNEETASLTIPGSGQECVGTPSLLVLHSDHSECSHRKLKRILNPQRVLGYWPPLGSRFSSFNAPKNKEPFGCKVSFRWVDYWLVFFVCFSPYPIFGNCRTQLDQMQNFILKAIKGQDNRHLISKLDFLKSKSLRQIDNLQNSLIKLAFISKLSFAVCQEKQAYCFPRTGATIKQKRPFP